MSAQHYQQVAETIMNQIGFGDGMDGRAGTICMLSWGAKKFRWHEASESDRHMGALSFRVNGFIFKGIVQVELAYDDTYRVRFLSSYRLGDARESINDVYCDELTRTIDAAIEHSGDRSAYGKQASKFMFEALANV